MKNLFLVITLFVLTTTIAKAENWELSGSTNFNLTFSSDGDYSNNREHSTYIDWSSKVGYVLTDLVELQVGLSGRNVTGASEGFTITPMLGAKLNISEDFANSFYLSAMAGPRFRKFSNSHSYTVLSYEFAFGKRFEIVKNVSWMPEISYVGHTSGTYTTNYGQWTLFDYRAINITPFQLAVTL